MIFDKRLAFGVQAILPVVDRVEAYRLLQGLLKDRIRFETEGSSDFIYQINHPVRSKTGIMLNRLTKWSAMAVQVVQFQVGTMPTTVRSIHIAEFASLECDFNTPADRQEPLDSAALGLIYDELVNLAWENIEMGEIP